MKSFFKRLLHRWRTTRNPLLLFIKEAIWFGPLVYKAAPGAWRRWAVNSGMICPDSQPLNRNEKRPHEIIVSMTSYGRRVAKTAPTAITSLMRQTLKPDRIILWLSRDEFQSADHLPASIKRLISRGLEVRFCDEMRSYKKMIPVLKEFDDAWIVTADDDLYFQPDALEQSWATVEANQGKCLVCRAPYRMKFSPDGSLRPYREWTVNSPCGNFPLSGFITWMRKDLLHPDITNYVLAKQLSPIGDDIWDFFMAFLAGTPIVAAIPNCEAWCVDLWHQHWHSGASLASANLYGGENDTQIRAVMNHYGITDADLYKAISQSQKPQ